jgi:hypothetical protein
MVYTYIDFTINLEYLKYFAPATKSQLIMGSYTADTTGEEVASDCRSQIANKTIIVTGVSPGGLGAHFAITIAKYGPACLILCTRNIAKAEETAREVAAVAPTVRSWPIELDLGSQKQIREAVEKINSLGEHIDVIVNNAGIMAAPYSKTVDGTESQFGINHIGHFLLTNLLLSNILAKSQPVRVVNVSSNGFRLGAVRFEDWNFDVRKVNTLFSRSRHLTYVMYDNRMGIHIIAGLHMASLNQPTCYFLCPWHIS